MNNDKGKIENDTKTCALKNNDSWTEIGKEWKKAGNEWMKAIKGPYALLKLPFVIVIILWLLIKFVIKDHTKNRKLASVCVKLEEIEALGFKLVLCYNWGTDITIEMVNVEYYRYPLTFAMSIRVLDKEKISKYINFKKINVEDYVLNLSEIKQTEKMGNFIKEEVLIKGIKARLNKYEENIECACNKNAKIKYVSHIKLFIKREGKYYFIYSRMDRNKYSITENNIATFKMILERVRGEYVSENEIINWLKNE